MLFLPISTWRADCVSQFSAETFQWRKINQNLLQTDEKWSGLSRQKQTKKNLERIWIFYWHTAKHVYISATKKFLHEIHDIFEGIHHFFLHCIAVLRAREECRERKGSKSADRLNDRINSQMPHESWRATERQQDHVTEKDNTRMTMMMLGKFFCCLEKETQNMWFYNTWTRRVWGFCSEQKMSRNR